MNLHEYQAKELLKKYNVPVQEGVAVETVEAAVEAYNKIASETKNKFAVVKAQIHAGGRGRHHRRRPGDLGKPPASEPATGVMT